MSTIGHAINSAIGCTIVLTDFGTDIRTIVNTINSAFFGPIVCSDIDTYCSTDQCTYGSPHCNTVNATEINSNECTIDYPKCFTIFGTIKHSDKCTIISAFEFAKRAAFGASLGKTVFAAFGTAVKSTNGHPDCSTIIGS